MLFTATLLATVLPAMTGRLGMGSVTSTHVPAAHTAAPIHTSVPQTKPIDQKSGPAASKVDLTKSQAAPATTAALEKAQKAALKAAEHAAQKAAQKASQEASRVLKEEQEKSASLYAEVAAAKRAISAAEEHQRQLTLKLEEASKREGALLEQNRRLSKAKSTAAGDSGKAKWGEKSTKETTSAGSTTAPQTYVQRMLEYLSTWGITGLDAGLLGLETVLLAAASVLLISLRRAHAAANKAKQEYLVAHGQQKNLLAKAQEVLTYAEEQKGFAAIDRAIAESITREALEAAAAGGQYTPTSPLNFFEDESNIINLGGPSSSSQTEKELQKQVEDATAAAAAQKSVWAQTAAQLLEVTTSPTKGGVTSPSASPTRGARKSLLKNFDGQGSPPSPASVAQAVADRCAELRARVTAAEAAAVTATKEREYSDQRASEMLTDNELLKERLAETNRALDDASEAKKAAKEYENEVKAALEMAQANLAAVEAEKSSVARQAHDLRAQLEAAEDRERASSRNSDHQEAQIEQLTLSLADESKQKQVAEQRCRKVETDFNNLQLLADSLQGQVHRLERDLVESHAIQTELKAAVRQLQTAHANFTAAAAPATSPTVLQRVMAEEAAALERLSTVERRAAQTSPLKDDLSLSPLPSYPSARSTPNNAKVHPLSKAAHLISRAGQISEMLSNMETSWSDADEKSSPVLVRKHNITGIPSPPVSRLALPLPVPIPHQRVATLRSVTPGSSPSTSGSLTARLSKSQQLISEAGQALSQELPDEYPLKENSNSTQQFNPASRPYEEVPLLLSGRRESSSRNESSGGVDRGNENNNNNNVSNGEGQLSRLAAIVDESTQAAAGLLPQIAALGTDMAEEAHDQLELAQQKVITAMNEVEIAASAAEESRRQHVELDSKAKEQERHLQDCQLALVASKQETPEDERSIAAAAQELELAEIAKQNAAEAVYHAERAIHAAVKAELDARDALRAEQNALSDALTTATKLLTEISPSGQDKDNFVEDYNTGGNNATPPPSGQGSGGEPSSNITPSATTTSIPGSKLRPPSASSSSKSGVDPRSITELFDSKFQGVPSSRDYSRRNATSVAASAIAAQMGAKKTRSPAR